MLRWAERSDPDGFDEPLADPPTRFRSGQGIGSIFKDVLELSSGVLVVEAGVVLNRRLDILVM